MESIRFKLYVAGQTLRSQQAIANLERLGREHLSGRYHLEVVDVTQDPEAAETDRILTTPTLIKRTPLPERRVTGDLADGERVLLGLALHPRVRADRHPELP